MDPMHNEWAERVISNARRDALEEQEREEGDA